MTKPCGHPDHPEDGNFGLVPVGGTIRILRGTDVEAHRADPPWFIGKYCKLGFPVPDTDKKEFMWVLVKRLLDGKELCGLLANTPIQIRDLPLGTEVIFTADEVLDVDEDGLW